MAFAAPLNSNFWYVHGKKYDFTPFLKTHPGGDYMLLLGKGRECTELFESVHSMTGLDRPNSLLSKYEVEEMSEDEKKYSADIFSWEEKGFYSTITKRVRKHFGNRDYKAQWSLYFRLLAYWIVFCFAWYKALQTGNVFYAILSGSAVSFVLFNLMHDSSHGALSKSPEVNYAGLMYSSFLWWNPWDWLHHHVFSHHSYTGIFRMDPDIVNAAYWIRKHDEVPKNVFTKYQPYLVWFLLAFLPGQHLGQLILYTFAKNWRAMFNPSSQPMPPRMLRDHLIISVFTVLFHFVLPFYLLSFISALQIIFVHASVMGLLYFLAVAPNHDQAETVGNNDNNSSKWGFPKQRVDWGEQQVRASGNHSSGSLFWGPIFNCIFGGLNYQIEHHLFPTISHVHYPELQPIVKKACEEFNIPYNGDNSFLESIASFQKVINKHSH